jgi:DNA-binding transcriptional ArsR family regulator
MVNGTSAGTSGDDRVIDVDDEAAGDLFDALSSRTARELLARLEERPSTPSELAASCDTSRQNVHHHLSALEEAGLVEVVTTTESETGQVVDVYGPTDRAVVRFGEDDGRSTWRLLGLFALGTVSLVATTAVWGQFGGWTVGVPFFLGGASVMVGWCLLGVLRR